MNDQALAKDIEHELASWGIKTKEQITGVVMYVRMMEKKTDNLVAPGLRVIEFERPEHNHDREMDVFQGLRQQAAKGWFELAGKNCRIYLEPRPGYCGRGDWIAKIFPTPGSKLDLSLDASDLWPRYYFSLGCATSEIKAWLVKRGEWADAKWEHHTAAELEDKEGEACDAKA